MMAAAGVLMTTGEAMAEPVTAISVEPGLKLEDHWISEQLRDLPSGHRRIIETLAEEGRLNERALGRIGFNTNLADFLNDMREAGEFEPLAPGQDLTSWWQEAKPRIAEAWGAELDDRQTNVLIGAGIVAAGAVGLQGWLMYLQSQERNPTPPNTPKRHSPADARRTAFRVIDGDRPDHAPPRRTAGGGPSP